MQRFIEEMSGARLPIVNEARGNAVLLGGGAARLPVESFGAEGFVLRTSGGNLIVAGGRERGTMYGVYTLLDKLGVPVVYCRGEPDSEAFGRSRSRRSTRRTVRGSNIENHFSRRRGTSDWAARNRTNGDHTKLDASTGGEAAVLSVRAFVLSTAASREVLHGASGILFR